MTSSNGLSFTYDDEGRMTSETFAPGKVVSFAYDNRGLLSQITDWIGGATTLSYDAGGRLTGIRGRTARAWRTDTMPRTD